MLLKVSYIVNQKVQKSKEIKILKSILILLIYNSVIYKVPLRVNNLKHF